MVKELKRHMFVIVCYQETFFAFLRQEVGVGQMSVCVMGKLGLMHQHPFLFAGTWDLQKSISHTFQRFFV